MKGDVIRIIRYQRKKLRECWKDLLNQERVPIIISKTTITIDVV